MSKYRILIVDDGDDARHMLLLSLRSHYETVEACDGLDALSRSVEADLVFTHAGSDLHQDHRTLSELTWNHFRRHTILEYEIVKYDGNPGPANLFVPLSSAQVAGKLDALMTAFASQASKTWFTRSTFEAVARLRGVESGSPSGYAEAFHARKLLLNPELQS